MAYVALALVLLSSGLTGIVAFAVALTVSYLLMRYLGLTVARAALLALAGSLCLAAMVLWKRLSLDCSGPDPDISVTASERALPLLFRARTAIRNLRAKGVLTDDVQGAVIANCARLEVAARIHGDPDALFLIFGDPRVGHMTSFTNSATAAEATIDNWIQLFHTWSSQERSAVSTKP